MKETKEIEYKETVSRTFLKTVSAYANYGQGKILFGVNDEGETVGVRQPVQTCLDIENQINDSIDPKPSYTLAVLKDDVVCLTVQKGEDTPYLYKGKAYCRNDTATIEVDRGQLNRLVLAGTHQTYDELSAKQQELTFRVLERELQTKIGISELSTDVLRTLNLYDQTIGFNRAAALLADHNDFPGIDVVRFGNSINEILDRATFAGESVLQMMHQAMQFFRQYYQYETIDGLERETKFLIPEVAFREAIANALVHRVWDLQAHINVAMFADRIEITSLGGLPTGVSATDYLNGNVAVARNPILAGVFYRLHYIEQLGTGVRRIKESYQPYPVVPTFGFTSNSVRVILPVVTNRHLTTNERQVINYVQEAAPVGSRQMAADLGYNKSKLNRILNQLIDDHLVVREGAGRATCYHLADSFMLN